MIINSKHLKDNSVHNVQIYETFPFIIELKNETHADKTV